MKKLLGILGLFIGTVAMFFGILFAPEIKSAILGNGNNGPTQDVEEPGEPTGDVVADVQNSDMLKLSKRNKISANGQVLSVSATLSPDWITDKRVSWSLAWNGSSSEIVSQYVSITPSADTLTCEVKVLKGFNTQIVLTCTATSNSQVKATCTIDYVGRNLYMTSKIQDELDIYGEKYSDYTIQELLNECGYSLDSAIFDLTGGTLKGTAKNASYESISIAEVDVNLSDLNQTLEDFMISNWGSVGQAVDNFNNCLYLEVYYKADVYYNNTLIVSNLRSLSVSTNLLVDESGYSATDITLSDTQLIF